MSDGIVPVLDCHLLDTGYCLAGERHLIQGGRRQQLEIHALVALLGHPTEGWLLWDAGYSPRMLAATERFPYRIYRSVTPLHLTPELAVAAQLSKLGLTPAAIRRVIVSHFHADHIAGLRDFPDAGFVAARSGYESVADLRGLRALRRGFIPELLPPDFERRALLLDEFSGPPLEGLGPTVDLFGDGSAILLSLPGHARGQLGLWANTRLGSLLFVADSCWVSRSYRDIVPPHWITKLLIDDFTALRSTLRRLHEFHQRRPDVTIIPSHCPEVYHRFIGARR